MLENIIAQMIYNIEISGFMQSRTLKNGLTIEIHPQVGYYVLILLRQNAYPSDKEWETVINHFPYELVETKPTKKDNGTTFMLIAEIPKERR